MLNADMRRRITDATKNAGSWVAQFWGTNLPEILAVGGASAVTVGAGMTCGPAGWITGGVLSIVGAVCAEKSKGV
ncbi:hypothetical protein [Amycolatopsis sp. lyj-23]|uniref:hypothetical protein n=1 Tax=Amycolatopsis sp. lyj-23 TaxID=2789283 RepID=UPI00397E3639